MKFREIERILIADGWRFKCAVGSHHQYIHSKKPGKVTVPYHTGDVAPVIVRSIFRQAGISRSNK
ncbi:MAG: type II toxin-antitoxin system HicA family toxin [Treponema sp.]|nr:type II toxin-antitoxin system HicA family toxin [Treponema sp.]